jgi:hypothetical protein
MNNLVVLNENAKFRDILKALSQPGVHRVPVRAESKNFISKMIDEKKGILLEEPHFSLLP